MTWLLRKLGTSILWFKIRLPLPSFWKPRIYRIKNAGKYPMEYEDKIKEDKKK